MTTPATLTPGIVPADTIPALISNGFETLKRLAPNHDPIRGHRPNDGESGTSSTFANIKTIEELTRLSVVSATAKAGHGGWELARTVECDGGEWIGYWAVPSQPISGTIHIAPNHGDKLQALAIPNEVTCSVPTVEPTKTFSVVFTNEEGTWVLASAYPGPTDPEPNFKDLKKGDTITADEAKARNMRVKIVTPEELHDALA